MNDDEMLAKTTDFDDNQLDKAVITKHNDDVSTANDIDNGNMTDEDEGKNLEIELMKHNERKTNG